MEGSSMRDKSLVLRYAPRRVRCPACGPRLEYLPWANRWQRVTRALSRSIATLSRLLSWQETAKHFGVDWKTVATVVKRAVEWGLEHRPWKPLRVLGIDEVETEGAAVFDPCLRPGTKTLGVDR